VFQIELNLMKYIREKEYFNEFFEVFCKYILYLTELNFIEYACVAIYLYSDPLLAFK